MDRSVFLFLVACVAIIFVLFLVAVWTRKPLYFFAVFLIALFWLFAPTLLQGVNRTALDNATLQQILHFVQDNASEWFALPLTLGYLVFLAYVWRGGDSEAEGDDVYATLIAPRKGVWVVFGAVLFIVLFFLASFLLGVNRSVTGLAASYGNLITAIGDTEAYSGELAQMASDKRLEETKRTDLSRAITRVQEEAGVVKRVAKSLEITITDPKILPDLVLGFPPEVANIQHFAFTVRMADSTNSQTIRLSKGRGEAIIQTVTLSNTDPLVPLIGKAQTENTLEQVVSLASDIISATQQLSNTVSSPQDSFDAELAAYHAYEIHRLATQLGKTSAILSFENPIALSSIAVLYALFLLFPWLLYLAFIISKRATVVRINRKALADLGLLDRLLDASEGLGDREQETARLVGRELWMAVHLLDKSPEARDAAAIEVASECIDRAFKMLEERLIKHQPMLQALKEQIDRIEVELRALQQPDQGAQTNDDATREHKYEVVLQQLTSARDEAIEIIIKQRQFYSREYIIPLIMLSLLSGVGWYYTFFPNAIAGLAQFYLQGGTVVAFANYVIGSLTAVTMTFIGGWLYIALFLIHRWTEDDLYPRSFFYASMRLILAFLIGILFIAILPEPTVVNSITGELSPNWILAVPFLVGLMPFEVLWVFVNTHGPALAKKLNLKGMLVPKWSSTQPIATLDDITIWTAERFNQEGIESVHALATADLVMLILNTPFTPHTLMDWVDQALLAVYATDLWLSGFPGMGVRTATNLVDLCLPDAPMPSFAHQNVESGAADIKRLVEAYNSMRLASLTEHDPRLPVLTAGRDLQRAAAALQKPLEEVRTTWGQQQALDDEAGRDNLLSQLDGSNTENVLGLRSLLEQLHRARSEASQSLDALGTSETYALAVARQALAPLAGDDSCSAAWSLVRSAVDRIKDFKSEHTAEQHQAIQDCIDRVIKATEKAKVESEESAQMLTQLAMPQQLTPEILHNILVSMSNDPNLGCLRRYWSRQGLESYGHR